jgi:hypothetical protein
MQKLKQNLTQRQLLAMCAMSVFGLAFVQQSRATFVSGTVSASADGQTTNNTVSGLPYATPAVASTGNVASTTTPELSDLNFKATFSDDYVNADVSASNELKITFTADGSTTYSIFGGVQTTASVDTLGASLLDQTTNTELYFGNSMPEPTGTTLDISTQVGSPTGGLTAGDTYVFDLVNQTDDNLAIPYLAGLSPDAVSPDSATSIGSGGITLVSTAVPEPGCIMIAVGGLLMLLPRRWRNANTSV